MRSFCGSLFGAAKKTCGWHISEAELPLGLVTPTDVLRWRRQRGGFIRLCWNGKSGHQCVAVAAAAACGFITSKRRHCVNGAAGMLLTQMQQTLTDGRNAGAGFGNRESRQVLTAALPAVRFLLLLHSSADPGAAAIFSFFPFLSRPWAKARSRQKNKKNKTRPFLRHCELPWQPLSKHLSSQTKPKKSAVFCFFFTFRTSWLLIEAPLD